MNIGWEPEALLTGARELLTELGEIPSGHEAARMEELAAIGGMAVIYRGRTTSGERVAAKIPLEFVAYRNELGSEERSEELEQAGDRLQQEADWLHRLRGAGLFPEMLFPKTGTEVYFPWDDVLLPLIVMRWHPGLPLRAGLSAVAGRQILAAMAPPAEQIALARVVGSWIHGVISGLRTILHAHDGVFVDVAPDNFLVGASGPPVVFLDAGAIVDRSSDQILPVRRAFVPAAYQEDLFSMVHGDRADVEKLLLGMVAKLVTAGLAGDRPSRDFDLDPVVVESRMSLAPWLWQLLAGGLPDARSRTGGKIATFDEALAILEGAGVESSGRADGAGEISVWRQADGG